MRVVSTLRTTAAAGVVGLVVVGSAGFASAAWTPPGDTITKITGTRFDGFTIERYDGTVTSPPTDSEARAECGEYDTVLARVRCRVQVRTWYDALGDTKRALRYARTR